MNEEAAKRADDLILAIDCGTQSVRALLVDLKGDVAAKAQAPLAGYVLPQAGWLEHDAEAFWRETAGVCRRLWARDASLKARTRAVAVTTQRGTLIPVGADGKALSNAIIWLDQRRTSRDLRALPLARRIGFALAGVNDLARAFLRESEIAWLADHSPAVHQATEKYLLLSGWLNYRLTGRYADSAASQVGYLPFDFRRQQWTDDKDWTWRAISVRRDQLPDLVAPGAPLGAISARAAEETGIPQGLPVIAAAGDKACEIVGAGAVSEEFGALSYGTTATVNITSPRYFEAIRHSPPYPALIPGYYNCEVQTFRGYWMVSWFRDQFAQQESAVAAGQGVAVESLFEKFLDETPPGARGLIAQPYWTPGARTPESTARGAIIGFTAEHTRAHVYRAILEGLAFELRSGKERIEARSQTKITRLRVAGGGSQSDAAMQLTADIFNLSAERPHTYEASGVGAAIAGAVGAGLYPDFAAAIAAMTRPGREFTPRPENARLYEELFAAVYRPMYGRLAPLYRRLAAISP